MTSNHDTTTQPHLGSNPGVSIRDEAAKDADAIGILTRLAFMQATHSSGTEQFIVAALRRADRLTVSLVATHGPELIGHVAISPVGLSTGETDWHGLGPLSVHPRWQRQGVGSALVRAALDRLRRLKSRGCVVLGDPGYYARFGFKTWPDLSLPGVPARYFQALPLGHGIPRGEVSYHAAFSATE
ncbi:GCN5 family N-acetyltransferase [[Pseudomonas] boreopolis]|uniref:GCN5 family N-acetyltransferase n=1 Tax=Xanthomonas boreopolis TaxID=86183 RepID=A0A919F9V3_9XANT|nr:GCN5 family N-acetyltransferase [[Pseudomonas] boreopolis]